MLRKSPMRLDTSFICARKVRSYFLQAVCYGVFGFAYGKDCSIGSDIDGSFSEEVIFFCLCLIAACACFSQFDNFRDLLGGFPVVSTQCL